VAKIDDSAPCVLIRTSAASVSAPSRAKHLCSWLWIDKHDDAYQWARSPNLSRSTGLGALTGGWMWRQPKRRWAKQRWQSSASFPPQALKTHTAPPQSANDASHSSRRQQGRRASSQPAQRRLDVWLGVPEGSPRQAVRGRLKDEALARLDRVAPPGLRRWPHSPAPHGRWQADRGR